MKSVKDYSVKTFDDIIRILEEEPEWRDKLRRLVLTDELLELPKRFNEFVEKDFRPLSGRVDKIEGDVEQLKKDVDQLKKDVEQLKKDVEQLKKDVEQLKKDVEQLKKDVAALKGDNFERKVREKAPAYFGRILRRIRLVDHQNLADMLDDALDEGIITEEERMELLWADGVIKGKTRDRKEDVWVVFEVSYVVNGKDVRRALKRAIILKKVVGKPVLPIVVGKEYAIPRKEIEEAGVIAL